VFQDVPFVTIDNQLRDPATVRRIARGVKRIDCVQVGNRRDVIVNEAESFAGDAWRVLVIDQTCLGDEAVDVVSHRCVTYNAEVHNLITRALEEHPPIWSGAKRRAPPLEPYITRAAGDRSQFGWYGTRCETVR
jgi:hypothetical protein